MPYPMSLAQKAPRGRLIPANAYRVSRLSGLGAFGATDTPGRFQFESKEQEEKWYSLLGSICGKSEETQSPDVIVWSERQNPQHPELGTKRAPGQRSLLDHVAFWLEQAPTPDEWEKVKGTATMKQFLAKHPRGPHYVYFAFKDDENNSAMLILSRKPLKSEDCALILPGRKGCEGFALLLDKGEELPEVAKKLLSSGDSGTSWGTIAAVAAGVFLLGAVVMTGMTKSKRATANRSRRRRRSRS